MVLAWTDLSPKDAAALLATSDLQWTRQLVDELDRAVRTAPLERFAELWGLSSATAASVFGVFRQAFAKWLTRGVPASRADSVADIAAATDLLDHYLLRERIPAVVRRPAAMLDGRSLLDIASEGDTAAVLEGSPVRPEDLDEQFVLIAAALPSRQRVVDAVTDDGLEMLGLQGPTHSMTQVIGCRTRRAGPSVHPSTISGCEGFTHGRRRRWMVWYEDSGADTARIRVIPAPDA